MVTPVREQLQTQPLSAKVDTGQAADSDGFFYKAGDLVEISADMTVKKLTTSGRVFGQLDTSIHEDEAPDGLNGNHKVAVLTPHKYMTEITAEGTIAAGDDLVAGTVGAGTLKAASNLAIEAGATPVTSSAANGEILEGATLPEKILGTCWKGATDGNQGYALI